MKPRSASTMFAAACVAAASAAHALPLSERTSFELFAGGNVSTPGAFRGPMSIQGADTTTDYTRLGFDDAYRHDYSAGAEFDYNVDSHLTTFARAAYSQLNGQNHQIGFSSSSSELTDPVPIEARFADTDTRALDVGARYTFATGEKWRPFLGASLGASRWSDSYATVDNTRVTLAKADTVFEQRLETGLQYSPMHNFDVRLTAAATHVNGGGTSDDPNLALLGLDETNSGVHAHWNYPAEIGAVWHF